MSRYRTLKVTSKGAGIFDLFKTNNRTTRKKMQCSPIVAGKSASKTTCYTDDVLLKIRDAYHRTHPNEPKIPYKSPKKILGELKKRMETTCKAEDCWLSLLPENQRKYLDQMIFAPDQPLEWEQNPDEWLSNYDIINVLKQYAIAYPKFEFIEPSPIDFDTKLPTKKCVSDDLCTFELSDYVNRGVEKIGICFNLDDHAGPGTHWVSMIIDIPNKIIFYFDSALFDTPPEITIFVDRVLKQSNELGLGIQYHHNARQHQFGNSECGMYSLFFIITMLTEKWGGTGAHMPTKQRIQFFKNRRITDKTVSEFRNRYFNSS